MKTAKYFIVFVCLMLGTISLQAYSPIDEIDNIVEELKTDKPLES